MSVFILEEQIASSPEKQRSRPHGIRREKELNAVRANQDFEGSEV